MLASVPFTTAFTFVEMSRTCALAGMVLAPLVSLPEAAPLGVDPAVANAELQEATAASAGASSPSTSSDKGFAARYSYAPFLVLALIQHMKNFLDPSHWAICCLKELSLTAVMQFSK